MLQPDITWCGGMTEARRIVALAAAYDIPIIPHGSSIYSYHLQICFPNCPMAEFLVMSPKADSIGEPYFIIIDQNLRTSNNFDLTETYDLYISVFSVVLWKSIHRRASA